MKARAKLYLSQKRSNNHFCPTRSCDIDGSLKVTHLCTSIIAFAAINILSAKTHMDLKFRFWQYYNDVMCLMGLTSNVCPMDLWSS